MAISSLWAYTAVISVRLACTIFCMTFCAAAREKSAVRDTITRIPGCPEIRSAKPRERSRATDEPAKRLSPLLACFCFGNPPRIIVLHLREPDDKLALFSNASACLKGGQQQYGPACERSSQGYSVRLLGDLSG